jgi:hypothetical protein
MRGMMAKNEFDDPYIYREREREREKGYHLCGDQVKELVLMKLLLVYAMDEKYENLPFS